MRHRSDPKVVLASFVAAGFAVLPLLLILTLEISKGDADDAAMRGFGIIFGAILFVYPFTTLSVFTLGRILLQLGVVRWRAYLSIAIVLSMLMAFGFSFFGIDFERLFSKDGAAFFGSSLALALASMVPAAWSWWFLCGRKSDA